MALDSRPIGKHAWIADSGMPSHITHDHRTFLDYQLLTEVSLVGIGDKQLKILIKGTVTIILTVNNISIPHTLHNVLHVPEHVDNLGSIGRFDDAGWKALFKDNKCTLLNWHG